MIEYLAVCFINQVCSFRQNKKNNSKKHLIGLVIINILLRQLANNAIMVGKNG